MANRWRLRPRFSLWAMLVLITVVSVVSIPLGYLAQRRLRSWEVVLGSVWSASG
jgi:endonuclease/exonuclease/phosphatase family metal-dependent hydrolase